MSVPPWSNLASRSCSWEIGRFVDELGTPLDLPRPRCRANWTSHASVRSNPPAHQPFYTEECDHQHRRADGAVNYVLGRRLLVPSTASTPLCASSI